MSHTLSNLTGIGLESPLSVDASPDDVHGRRGGWWDPMIYQPDCAVESFTAQTKMTFDQPYEGKMSCYVIPSSRDGILSIDRDCVLKGFKRCSDQTESWFHVRSVLTVTIEVPPRHEIGFTIGATMIRPFFPKSFEVFTDTLLETTVSGQRAKSTSYSSLLHMSSTVKTETAIKASKYGADQFVWWRGATPPRREWYYIVGVDVFSANIKYVNANVHLRSDFAFKRVPTVIKLDRPIMPQTLPLRRVLLMGDRAGSWRGRHLLVGDGVSQVTKTPGGDIVHYMTKSDAGSCAVVDSKLPPLPPPIAKPDRTMVVREQTGMDDSVPVQDDLTDKFLSLVVQDIPTNCGKCAMCDTMASMTKHHLVPKEVHNRCSLPKAVMDKTINICRPCHDAIHKFHTNAELALEFSTVESLVQLAKSEGRVCQQIASNVNNICPFNYVGNEGTILAQRTVSRSFEVPKVEYVSKEIQSEASCTAANIGEIRRQARRIISPGLVVVPTVPFDGYNLNDVD